MSKPIELTRYSEDPDQAPDVAALLSYLDTPPPLTPTVKAWSSQKLQAQVRYDRRKRWARPAAAMVLAAAAAFSILWLRAEDGSRAAEHQLHPLSDVEMKGGHGEPLHKPAAHRPHQLRQLGSVELPPQNEPSARPLPPQPQSTAPTPLTSPSARRAPSQQQPRPAPTTSSPPAATSPSSASAAVGAHVSPSASAGASAPSSGVPAPVAVGPSPSSPVLVDPHASPTPPRPPKRTRSTPPRPPKRTHPNPSPAPRRAPGPVIVNPHASPTPPDRP